MSAPIAIPLSLSPIERARARRAMIAYLSGRPLRTVAAILRMTVTEAEAWILNPPPLPALQSRRA